MALTRERLMSAASSNAVALDSLALTSCFRILLRELGISLQILSLKNNCLASIDITLGFSSLRKLDLSSNLLFSIGPPNL